MYPIEPRAAQLLGESHGIAARLWASINGSSFTVPLQLIEDSASVDVDAGSAARRTLTAEVVASLDEGAVDPLGTELLAEYAIVDPTNGTHYWTPVGTFVITEAQEVDENRVSIKGVDRWQRVLDARLERPITTSGNTLAAIESLLLGADGRIVVDTSAAPTGDTHRATLHERDRDKAIHNLARSIGCTVYFDPLGVARVEPVQPLTSEPAWRIAQGERGTKVRSVRGVSRARTYNAVSVTGESDGDAPPVYGLARDTDPASATRWGGPFGRRTRFYSSTLVTTTAQANRVAQSHLDSVRGVARTVTVDAIQHPGLDADDVIAVNIAGRDYVNMRVQSFTLTLGPAVTSIDAATDAELDDEGE